MLLGPLFHQTISTKQCENVVNIHFFRQSLCKDMQTYVFIISQKHIICCLIFRKYSSIVLRPVCLSPARSPVRIEKNCGSSLLSSALSKYFKYSTIFSHSSDIFSIGKISAHTASTVADKKFCLRSKIII